MPPKKVYLKEDILNAGMEIVRENGFNAISARSTAKKIKSSQIPIYSYFNSIDELKNEIRFNFETILYKFMEEKYTENKILNAAIGVCIFAREEKRAFNELFLTDKNIKENIKNFVSKVYDIFEQEERFKSVKPEVLDEILKDIWIYTHGLAVLINTDLMENSSNQEIIYRILGVAKIIIKEKSKGEEDGKEI